MKNCNIIKSLTASLVLLLSGSIALTGCSNDDTAGTIVVKEGVVFNFKRKVVYATGVDQIGSVKITVSDGTKRIELPSSRLTGDEELAKTIAFALPAGNYKLVGYKAYTKRQDALFEIELDSLNEFEVKPMMLSSFIVPVKMRSVFDQSPIRNALLGLCKEVFGNDETTWPWDPEKYPYPDWEGLEFEFDDYNTPMYISGISFSGKLNGKETPWIKMTAIPDGTISNMGTVTNIVITELPEFKHLPSDLEQMPSLNTLVIIDSGIEELPANLSAITTLREIVVNNCQLKEAPAGLAALTDMRILHLRGNQIAKLDVSLTQLTKLRSLDFGYNPMTSVAEGILPTNSTLNWLGLSHTQLSSVPSEVGRMSQLRSIDLTGCQFTSIPAPVKGNTGIKALYLGGNPLTLAASDFTNMDELEMLFLDGSKITSLPKLTLPHLHTLDVTGCGLTSVPNLSALPLLSTLYAGNNEFTTLPANYFASNPKMRILSLSDSPKLNSMPAGNLGLVAKITQTQQGFISLDVANCPALTWTTPAEWACFDATNEDYKPQTRRPDDLGGSISNEYFGRVMVNRKGSPNVTFGK